MTRTRLGRQTPRIGGTGAGVVTITEDGQLGRSATVGGLAVAWTPSNLTTLSLWLDADDATTITQSGGTVSQWNDKSSNARNVTQATGANQPSYVSGAQNGRAALRFDGTNAVLGGGDVLDILAGGLSVVVAYSGDTTSTLAVVSKSTINVDANGEWCLYSTRGEVYLGGANTLAGTGTNVTGPLTVSWVVDRSASSRHWRNGLLTDTVTGSPFPNTTSYNTASAFQVGGRDGSSTRFDGDIYEIVVSLTTLSTDDRQKCEGYLAHKWGLENNLVSSHPYRHIPPLVLA